MSYSGITCSTKILLISVGVLCEFAMLPEEEVHFLKGQMHISGSKFIREIEPFVFHYITVPKQYI